MYCLYSRAASNQEQPMMAHVRQYSLALKTKLWINTFLTGTFYEDRDDPAAPFLSQEGFDGTQDDIVLTLPDKIKVKDLKWISVWCREFALDFGSLNLSGTILLT